MTPPPLPVVGMSELDLNGVLFVEFPTTQTLAENRAMLERMIRRNGDAEISPSTVYSAFVGQKQRLAAALTGPERERRILAAHPGRFRPRFIENGANPAAPNALRWDAETKTAIRALRAEDWSF